MEERKEILEEIQEEEAKEEAFEKLEEVLTDTLNTFLGDGYFEGRETKLYDFIIKYIAKRRAKEVMKNENMVK